MSGATAKSNPTANKLDERELARLQRQDHWIVLSRVKLLMDLVFVCEYPSISRTRGEARCVIWAINDSA